MQTRLFKYFYLRHMFFYHSWEHTQSKKTGAWGVKSWMESLKRKKKKKKRELQQQQNSEKYSQGRLSEFNEVTLIVESLTEARAERDAQWLKGDKTGRYNFHSCRWEDSTYLTCQICTNMPIWLWKHSWSQFWILQNTVYDLNSYDSYVRYQSISDSWEEKWNISYPTCQYLN